jgi:hypothetical protein
MYVKPELQRFGTFREVTRNFNWCWMYPNFTGCNPTTPEEEILGQEEGGGTGEQDRS